MTKREKENFKIMKERFQKAQENAWKNLSNKNAK